MARRFWIGIVATMIGLGTVSTVIPQESEPQQDPQLVELARLSKEAQAAKQTGKLDEAIRLGREVVDLEVKLLGADHKELISTWSFIGECAESKEDWPTSLNARDEALRIATKVYGKDDYRVTDARLAKEHVTRLETMTASQRQRVRALAQADGDAVQLYYQGRYAEAVALEQTVLGDREHLLGPEHPDTATSLSNLAAFNKSQGNYAEAEPLFQRALTIYEKALGPEHPYTAFSLNNLAELHYSQGNYKTAETLFLWALKIREKTVGPEHPDTAMSLCNLAMLYKSQDNYAAAEPLCQRALTIYEKALGPEHPYTATSLNNLALLYYSQGNYKAAEPLYLRALKIREKALGTEHPDTATSLNNLAELYHSLGDYAAAEPLLGQALKIYEKALGPEHPNTALSLSNFEVLYLAQGNYAAAEPLFQRALTIREKALGPEHPDTATSLNNLAELYRAQGNYAAAEPLYQRALKIYEKALGPEHPDTASSLCNLAGLYESQGNYKSAEPRYLRALKIREKALGTEHPDTATSLNNLAELYRARGNYAAAEPLYQRALKIYEKALGPENPNTALSLCNLAVLNHLQWNYTAAEPLYQRALAIREKALGPDHPDTATSLNNLAALYREQGNYAAAEPLFQRALKIKEKALGPKHPTTATCRNNLALLFWQHLDPTQARPLVNQSLEATRENLEQSAAIQSEQQQFLMAQQGNPYLNTWLTIGSRSKSPPDDWTIVIPWKGLVTARQSLLRRDLKDEPLLAEYRQITQHLSRVAMAPPAYPNDPRTLPAWEARREQWQAEKIRLEQAYEQLEKELAKKSTAFAQSEARQQVTAVQITTCLAQQPRPTAFIDLYPYYHCGQGDENGEWRLAAYVARGDGRVGRVNLGDMETIQPALTNWRTTLGRGAEGQAAGQTLRERLWVPLEAELKDIEVVLISPDGSLAHLPWGALPGSKPGTYLIEEKSFAVIPIPQFVPELATTAAKHEPPPSLLLAGDIEYGGDPGDAPPPLPQLLAQSDDQRSAAIRDGRVMQFKKLDHAQAEFASVKERYERTLRKAKRTGTVDTLFDDIATEAAFREQAEKHAWLHVITHGYFAPETIKSALQATGPPNDGRLGREPRPPAGPLIHPGLLCGLAFAGANRPADPIKDDGILTALDITGLDLRNVDTVVLSACETGLGEVAGGEGLLGLQRAFQLSGAKTCVASLWKVPDAATARLMQRFYENLWEKKMGKLEALREAQLWMLHDDGARSGLKFDEAEIKSSEPMPSFYWAAFVLSGDWR